MKDVDFLFLAAQLGTGCQRACGDAGVPGLKCLTSEACRGTTNASPRIAGNPKAPKYYASIAVPYGTAAQRTKMSKMLPSRSYEQIDGRRPAAHLHKAGSTGDPLSLMSRTA